MKETLDRLVEPCLRDLIIRRALERAHLAAVPDNASVLARFVAGPLRGQVAAHRDEAAAITALGGDRPSLRGRLESAAGNQADLDRMMESEAAPLVVLVVHPDLSVRARLGAALRAQGFVALTALSWEFGLVLCQKHRPDLVICDMSTPQSGANHVAGLLCYSLGSAAPPIVIMSSCSDHEGGRLQGTSILSEPVDQALLLKTVHRHLDGSAISFYPAVGGELTELSEAQRAQVA